MATKELMATKEDYPFIKAPSEPSRECLDQGFICCYDKRDPEARPPCTTCGQPCDRDLELEA